MRKVLVPFDGSDHSKRALRYVIDFARDSGVPVAVHALNVQHKSSVHSAYMSPVMIDDALLAKVANALEETVRCLGLIPWWWWAGQLQGAVAGLGGESGDP